MDRSIGWRGPKEPGVSCPVEALGLFANPPDRFLFSGALDDAESEVAGPKGAAKGDLAAATLGL